MLRLGNQTRRCVEIDISLPRLGLMRELHTDHRSRLSNLWLPTGGIVANQDEDAHAKLVRGGFLRQSHSGLFHMLPLGFRVQDKIEKLIDKHMRILGASRVALSTISSSSLWEKSGRLSSVGSEIFRFTDRKDTEYLLSPTHEEEITSLVTHAVKSYKDLPLLLYQITRKYRDELRPRHGLLRSREFIMKDLYSFDYSAEAAMDTYGRVKDAYVRFFADMKLPIQVAKASSGDMGGDLSHEYHLATSLGEDHVVACNSCDYMVNDEIAETRPPEAAILQGLPASLKVWRGISKDRSVLVNVWYAGETTDATSGRNRVYSDADLNIAAIKSAFPVLDASVEDPLAFWAEATKKAAEAKTPLQLVHLLDGRVPTTMADRLLREPGDLPILPAWLPSRPAQQSVIFEKNGGSPLNLLRIEAGESCPTCHSGKLAARKAIELGHTFYLGTRYTDPFQTTVEVPNTVAGQAGGAESAVQSKATIHMGCYGIGVSRIIGAVADHLADETGLHWPRAIAPHEIVVIPGRDVAPEDAEAVYDVLSKTPVTTSVPGVDAVLDDRQKALTWKMKDADLVGYPIIVLLGREWAGSRRCEVQCRRLGIREQVQLEDLVVYVGTLFGRL